MFYTHTHTHTHTHWRRQWQATPVLLPRKSHEWRSLVGCSPWSYFKSDATERLHFYFSLSHNGEGNGNGRAWWASVCGVVQSRTRLKRLSSIYIYIFTSIVLNILPELM